MSIPRQLVKSFEIIKDCKLVVTKDPTEDNLKEFGKAMNNAIPDQANQISFMIYKFMRGMYLSDKEKFLNHICGMNHYEAMILWTDYDDILQFFELTGTIFLGWNKSVNKYQAAKIDLTKKKSTEEPMVKPDPARVEEIKQRLIKQAEETKVKDFEKADDYDVLFNRIAAIQQAQSQC